jgi:hypothetical protein
MFRISEQRWAVLTLVGVVCISIASQTAFAQTFSVIYSFAGGPVGRVSGVCAVAGTVNNAISSTSRPAWLTCMLRNLFTLTRA